MRRNDFICGIEELKYKQLLKTIRAAGNVGPHRALDGLPCVTVAFLP